MQKIPFHIISGFLGSGKTTFLKHFIEKYASEKKIGIIQNEFAPSNIDGVEIKKSGDNFNLLEINNGSVFCVCLLGNFIRSLEKFIDEYNPDILIIEASGLSDTTSISEITSSGKLSEKIFLASNWCIVDAKNYSRVGLMKQRVTHQLRMADFVVINKLDLYAGDTKIIEQEIKKINPFAQIQKTTYCQIDFEAGKESVNKLYFENQQSLPRPNVNSMVIKTTRMVSENSVITFLNEWAPKAYRIKGFIKLKEGKTIAIQCTFNDIKISEVKNDFHPTEIVALTYQFSLREWHKSFKSLP